MGIASCCSPKYFAMKIIMRKSLLLLFICSATLAFPQKDLDKEIKALRQRLDSSRIATDSFLKQQMKRNDSIEMARFNEQNARNLNSFMRDMQERSRKQKRAMWLRLIFGLALLGIGVFSVLRKRKKKEIQ